MGGGAGEGEAWPRRAGARSRAWCATPPEFPPVRSPRSPRPLPTPPRAGGGVAVGVPAWRDLGGKDARCVLGHTSGLCPAAWESV